MSTKSLANLPTSNKSLPTQILSKPPGKIPQTTQILGNPGQQGLPSQPPGQPPLPQNMQNIWQSYFQGKHQEVLQQAEAQLFRTGNVDYIHLAGLSMVATGRVKEGIEWLKASITLFPSPAWFSNAAIIALEAGQVEASMDFAKRGKQRITTEYFFGV